MLQDGPKSRWSGPGDNGDDDCDEDDGDDEDEVGPQTYHTDINDKGNFEVEVRCW